MVIIHGTEAMPTCIGPRHKTTKKTRWLFKIFVRRFEWKRDHSMAEPVHLDLSNWHTRRKKLIIQIGDRRRFNHFLIDCALSIWIHFHFIWKTLLINEFTFIFLLSSIPKTRCENAHVRCLRIAVSDARRLGRAEESDRHRCTVSVVPRRRPNLPAVAGGTWSAAAHARSSHFGTPHVPGYDAAVGAEGWPPATSWYAICFFFIYDLLFRCIRCSHISQTLY